MKRYFLPICFIAALSLFSCNNTTEEPENGGSTTNPIDTTTNSGDDDNDFIENQTFSSVVTLTWNGSSVSINNDVDGVTVSSNSNGYAVISSTTSNFKTH